MLVEMLNAANTHYQAGRLHEANQLCQQILQMEPLHPQALCLVGLIALQLKEYATAVNLITKAIEREPNNSYFWSNLGLAMEGLGERGEAVTLYRKALELDRNCVEPMVNLALALQNQGQTDEAQSLYQRALRIESNAPDILNNHGSLLMSLGKYEEAGRRFEKAIKLSSGFAQAHFNLGMNCRAQVQPDRAMACFAEAVRLQPQFAQAHFQMGILHKLAGRHADALICYQQASEADPSMRIAGMRAGALADLQGYVDQAEAAYSRLEQADPENPVWPLRLASLVPAIATDAEALPQYRKRLEAALDDLQSKNYHCDLEDIGETFLMPPYYFAYHGLDDTALRRRFAECIARWLPPVEGSVSVSPTAGRKLKIGFVVTEFHEKIFLKFMAGFIQHLDRSRFDVAVIGMEVTLPVVKETLGQLCGPEAPVDYVHMALNLMENVPLLRQAQFDALFFFEVGTDPKNYLLPFYRMAPVQCTSWGLPVTSGAPHVDYFLSSEWLEPAQAEAHYHEALVRMRHLPTYFATPVSPERFKSRAELGLPEEKHIYACPQNLYKFQPDFDLYLADILRADPEGLVVLTAGTIPHNAEKLKARLRQEMPDVFERICFLPFLSHDDYLSLLKTADVLLDPLHFGGGTTSYESFALGTPIVTQPGAFMRGRVTGGMYRLMGIEDCIAADRASYVALAVRLATDVTFRRSVSEKIATQRHELFENLEAVRELETFLETAVTQATQSSSIELNPEPAELSHA